MVSPVDCSLVIVVFILAGQIIRSCTNGLTKYILLDRKMFLVTVWHASGATRPLSR